jgi:hypothetical protein
MVRKIDQTDDWESIAGFRGGSGLRFLRLYRI